VFLAPVNQSNTGGWTLMTNNDENYNNGTARPNIQKLTMVWRQWIFFLQSSACDGRYKVSMILIGSYLSVTSLITLATYTPIAFQS